MPHFNGMLLAPNAPPVLLSVNSSKNALNDALRNVLGCDASLSATNCDLGVLYATESNGQPRNVLATQIRSKFSRKMPESLSITNGRCFLLGEDDKGVTSSLTKETVQTVFDLYVTLTGHSVPGRKGKKRSGPLRARRDIDYFSKVFQKSRRAELSAQNIVPLFASIQEEAREAWKNMSAEEKAPYLAQAAEDKVRYEREHADFKKKNPPRPKNPRTAYNLFCQDHPDKKADWKTQTEDQKAHYEAKAVQDKVRYEADLDVFRAHCEETGKDFAALISRKKKKRSESVASVSADEASDAPAAPAKKSKKAAKKVAEVAAPKAKRVKSEAKPKAAKPKAEKKAKPKTKATKKKPVVVEEPEDMDDDESEAEESE